MDNITKLKSLFNDQELLKQALTHRSWVNEHPSAHGNNERLEFLGDAVLEFLVSHELYNRFPGQEEGYLTALRANLVNTVNLSAVAKKLGIGKEILLSRGEEDGGGRDNSSLLADTLEAVIGAMFLDQGIEKVEKFVSVNIITDIPEKVKSPLKDPKSLFQEKIQAQGYPTPKYRVVSELGPDHDKKFIVEVVVAEKVLGSGEGKSKSLAEQDAARDALNTQD